MSDITAPRTTRFKQMLQNTADLSFICEAHNGLSAKIVEEAGFQGIWGSGLSISAAMGVRDNNEASWTQVLEVLEFMADNTTVPILLDGDTGYGNFNNMRRLVTKLEQRQVAAVCIEDKIFPKTNSFIKGEAQPLASVDEFCGKIKAGKDAQSDDDFSIVARTEAFIAGWGLAAALERAEAYRQAGADAILVHSKIDSPADVIAFMREWDNRHPVVIVPTMYFDTPTQVFRDLGISMVIWANHILRASIDAMRRTAQHLHAEESLHKLEPKLPSVAEIFRLQGMAEYSDWEKRYLPKSGQAPRAILLAATKGAAFGKLTEGRPKAMLAVEGRPIIATGVRTLREAGVRDITIVTGYAPDAFDLDTVKYAHNADWATTGEIGSLLAARKLLSGPVLIGYGDVVTRSFVLRNLVESDADFTVVVDYAQTERTRKAADLAVVVPPRSDAIEDVKPVDYLLQRVDAGLSVGKASGEWTGLLKCSESGTSRLVAAVAALEAKGTQVASWSLPQLLTHLVETGAEVHVQWCHGDWLDVDDILDLSDLYNF